MVSIFHYFLLILCSPHCYGPDGQTQAGQGETLQAAAVPALSREARQGKATAQVSDLGFWV